MNQIDDSNRWIMSFYRYSEISGALFFGKIAAMLPAGQMQHDLTKHFSDESMHSWYWTEAMTNMGYKPDRIRNAYQDAYLESAGLPVNLMEVLAITNIFEKRVIGQYIRHLKTPNLHPIIESTIKKIVDDEVWHIQWINRELAKMSEKFGNDEIEKKLEKYRQADETIYGKLLDENHERLNFLFDKSNPVEA